MATYDIQTWTAREKWHGSVEDKKEKETAGKTGRGWVIVHTLTPCRDNHGLVSDREEIRGWLGVDVWMMFRSWVRVFVMKEIEKKEN